VRSEALQELAARVELSSGEVVQISVQQADALLQYALLLSRWTELMDLVSSADLGRIIQEHILDSVAAFHCVSRETYYLDIGSGAGLPGIVFAILAPESRVVLLEPREKRAMFLKEVRRILSLNRCAVVQGRLEEFKLPAEPVHALQRALGAEEKCLRLLSAAKTDSLFSFIVSTGWEVPAIASQIVGDLSYKLPGGRPGRVVTAKCFT